MHIIILRQVFVYGLFSNSPSSRHGVSQEDEVQQRIFGCELIQEANILLKSPQVSYIRDITYFAALWWELSEGAFLSISLFFMCSGGRCDWPESAAALLLQTCNDQ